MLGLRPGSLAYIRLNTAGDCVGDAVGSGDEVADAVCVCEDGGDAGDGEFAHDGNFDELKLN